MKILHISGARSWGGNEQQLVDVIEELNKYEVENIIYGVRDFDLHQYSISNNISFIPCKDKKLNKFKNYKYLKEITKSLKPDIIHLHTSDSVTVFTIADLIFKLKIPAVFSKKGISRKMSLLSKYKYNYKNINKILCVSQIVKDHFEGVIASKNHDKLCVVYDGVKVVDDFSSTTESIKKTYQIKNNAQIIGNVANHNGAKDLTTFINTLNVLVNDKQIKNIHFLQVGAFTRGTPELKELISKYKLEDYITLTGFVENASSLLSQLDVFLMTSIREGGPTSVLEALYNKVPVVSTRVGVVNEAIKNGVNGFISEIEDYNDLADKIEILLNDESLKKSFTEISYQKFLNNFTSEKLGRNTYKVYQEVLDEN
jgi:glycosyltransferase involved in cell wall biosynthesis